MPSSSFNPAAADTPNDDGSQSIIGRTSPTRPWRFIPAHTSSAKSIATELRTPSPTTSTPHQNPPIKPNSGISNNIGTENRTLDLFDDTSSGEDIAATPATIGPESGFTDYPRGSTVGIKSPKIGKDGRQEQSPLTAGSGSVSLFEDNADPEGSTGEIKLRRGSGIWENDRGGFSPEKSAGKGSIRVQRTERAVEEGEPTADVPTLGKNVPGVGAEMESPKGSLPISPNITTSPPSPDPTIGTTATSSTTERAERDLAVPFLPKLLRVKGRSVVNGSRSRVPEGRANELESVSENEHSGEEMGVDVAKIQDGSQRRPRRPRVMQQASSTVVGLKEMLRGSGPVGTENNPGPSKRKLAEVLGNEVKFSKELNAKRAGVIGFPAARDVDGQPTGVGKAEDKNQEPYGLGIRKGPAGNFADGSRSNPVQRAATLPLRRKVTLSPPPNIELNPNHRFLRQSIVSTPYPLGFKSDAEMASNSMVKDRSEVTLRLVLHSHNTRTSRVKQLTIPGTLGAVLEDASAEKKPKTRATMRTGFDDEKLFKLIRAEYGAMRGPLRTLLSARNVHVLKLLSYHESTELANHEKSLYRRAFPVRDDGEFSEARMLVLYQKPRLGKRKHDWLDWIANLPENSENNHPQETLALQLIEGWCLCKIAFVVVTVVTLSLTATFLWTFLGPDGVSPSLRGTAKFSDPELSIDLRQSYGGYHGAGERAETGALLGMLTLILGWTGIGAWISLSWLI